MGERADQKSAKKSHVFFEWPFVTISWVTSYLLYENLTRKVITSSWPWHRRLQFCSRQSFDVKLLLLMQRKEKKYFLFHLQIESKANLGYSTALMHHQVHHWADYRLDWDALTRPNSLAGEREEIRTVEIETTAIVWLVLKGKRKWIEWERSW